MSIKETIKNIIGWQPNTSDSPTNPNILINPEPQIFIFTGAGLSEESGVPTFRTGDDGLWNNYKISEVCDAKTFVANKEKVFKFYNDRKVEYSNVQPNDAHKAIAQIQKQFKRNVKIYTTNIDDLLEKAGCHDVIHLHGHINTMNCLRCQEQWDIGTGPFTINTPCPNCNMYDKTKPGVILFNEKAPLYGQLFSDYSRGNIYKHGKWVPLIKIVIGASLKVISVEHLQPKRGVSLLLDPYPSNSEEFTETVAKKATEGIQEVNEFIAKHYVDK